MEDVIAAATRLALTLAAEAVMVIAQVRDNLEGG